MQTKRDSILPSCFQRFDLKGVIFKLQLAWIKRILRAMNKRYSCFHLVYCSPENPQRFSVYLRRLFKGLRASLKLYRAAQPLHDVMSPRPGLRHQVNVSLTGAKWLALSPQGSPCFSKRNQVDDFAMKGFRLVSLTLLALTLHTLGIEAVRKPGDSVLLSNVKTLTLRKDLKTSHRRVSAVPQA